MCYILFKNLQFFCRIFLNWQHNFDCLAFRTKICIGTLFQSSLKQVFEQKGKNEYAINFESYQS
jgi:hypothetical protein